MAILLILVFSKYVYLASMTSYFTFFLIHKFHISVQSAQLHLFGFWAASRRAPSRRSDRRSFRTQGRDLGIDSRRAALHALAAVRQSLLDRRPAAS
jgi:hypothetical protein